jgi:glycosyltransferase involved in cell wall biosynthesis
MPEVVFPEEAQRAAESIKKADIVIGIPSYNNARTIGHVVRAAYAGLAKYFPQLNGVVINSDGGSTDKTRDAVLSSHVDDHHLLMLSTPQAPAHRLSFPYHGIPGKGSAFRLVFQMAKVLDAKACAVVDSDLRSITPEWIDLLVRPILFGGYDFVAPYYHRHKYDGTITNSIVYPLTRALYGLRVRQPIGGEFGVSAPLLRRYLERDDWETDVARYGIDIWMTTIALAEGFRVCQSFLGAKLHDAKDPGSDLSAMLQQVVGSVFMLMREYEDVWKHRAGSQPAELFGFRFDVGLDPISVNVERMIQAFCRGCRELREMWELALASQTLAAVTDLAKRAEAGDASFHLEDDLWVRVVFDFAGAYKKDPISRGQLLRSLTPLYLARVASFVRETETMVASEVEERIEKLCGTYEELKPYLAERWNGIDQSASGAAGLAAREQLGETSQASLEASS